jgi:hypothetical protein
MQIRPNRLASTNHAGLLQLRGVPFFLWDLWHSYPLGLQNSGVLLEERSCCTGLSHSFGFAAGKAAKRGGFLYGFKNHFIITHGAEKEIQFVLDWGQLDTLCKILEIENTARSVETFNVLPMYDTIAQVFEDLRTNAGEINAHWLKS